jgi:cleavage and polyadenylation specificity factor subunit 1
MKLTAANGNPITTHGTADIKIAIRKLRREFSWKCVVADVVTPLLGADFLNNFNLCVDVRNKRLVDNTTKCSVNCTLCVYTAEQYPIYAVSETLLPDVAKLLSEYPEVTKPFKANEKTISQTRHYIETKSTPSSSRVRPLHGEKLEAAKREFAELQKLGIIRHSNSPWASPIHLVPKGDSWRVCGDYRLLNHQTEKDSYPMSNVSALTCILHGKAVFTKIDLVRGYNQIAMDDSSIAKTAVITPFGLFEYTRMPFGLCNASQTFQRFMNELFGHLDFVFVYIDDILIHSETPEEHREHLKQVLSILNDNGMKISLHKCSFMQTNVDFLGYQISGTGIKPSAKKCDAIQLIDLPTTCKELHSFLCTINFYRKHIPEFAKKSEKLYDRIKLCQDSKARIELTDDEVKEFVQLKMGLQELVELECVDPASNTFTITTDASKRAIGGVLHQIVNGNAKTIQFFSRKLKPPEERYSTFDRELLGAHDAVQYFKPYVDGQKVTLFTDHKPLVCAFAKKSECKSDRQARQFSFLSEYLCSLEYIRGEDNVVADFFSRPADVSSVQVDLFDLETMAKNQKGDEEVKKLSKINYMFQSTQLRKNKSFAKPAMITQGQ